MDRKLITILLVIALATFLVASAFLVMEGSPDSDDGHPVGTENGAPVNRSEGNLPPDPLVRSPYRSDESSERGHGKSEVGTRGNAPAESHPSSFKLRDGSSLQSLISPFEAIPEFHGNWSTTFPNLERLGPFDIYCIDPRYIDQAHEMRLSFVYENAVLPLSLSESSERPDLGSWNAYASWWREGAKAAYTLTRKMQRLTLDRNEGLFLKEEHLKMKILSSRLSAAIRSLRLTMNAGEASYSRGEWPPDLSASTGNF